MSNSAILTDLLNELTVAAKAVIPIPSFAGKTEFLAAPILQPEIGVLIGITGDLRGRLLLEGTFELFQAFGNHMFQMTLEGEMLESFAGEMGNMIAGNLSASIYKQNISIDITPPTVLVGQTKISGFTRAIHIPLSFESGGELGIVLMLEE
jgi:chemotaxis protein CheX